MQDVEKREADAERKIEGLTASLSSVKGSLTATETSLAQAQAEGERLRQAVQTKAGEHF